jgi:hypothetical protein
MNFKNESIDEFFHEIKTVCFERVSYQIEMAPFPVEVDDRKTLPRSNGL